MKGVWISKGTYKSRPMIIKTILMLEFWLLAMYGAFSMLRGARKMRAARKYKDVIFAWSERPISSATHDTIAWIGTSIHWLTIVLIGLIEFFILVNRSFSPNAFSLFTLLLITITPSVGHMWGSLVFQPIATYFAGNRHYALSMDGVLYAGNLIPWSAFSHFGFVEETKLIRLWSASLPGTIAFQFAPPEEHAAKIIDILQTHLANEAVIPPPNLIQQYLFPAVMTASCILTGVLIYFLRPLPLEITFIANAVLIYVLMLLGGPVLLRFLLGRNMQPAAME
jgi:hypothetical protein